MVALLVSHHANKAVVVPGRGCEQGRVLVHEGRHGREVVEKAAAHNQVFFDQHHALQGRLRAHQNAENEVVVSCDSHVRRRWLRRVGVRVPIGLQEEAVAREP
jgi:uncharacterized protein YigA (DUF484 family)